MFFDNRLKYFAIFGTLSSLSCVCHSGPFCMADFEDVREHMKDSDKHYFKTVSSVIPSGSPLTEIEIKDIFTLKKFQNLRTLDLKNQDLTDKDIELLSKNPSLGRVINIDLSENPRITAKSIQFVLDSPYLGSIRDIPQISDTYGLPASTLYLSLQGTSADPEEISQEKNIFRKNFSIHYKHPKDNSGTYPSADNGLKFVECKFW